MALNAEEAELVFKTVLGGRAFQGPAIAEYENLLSATLGVKHILLCPSARTGFYSLLDALFHKGDELLLSVFTFPLFVRLIREKGMKPIFVDVEPETGLINPEKIKEKISDRTRGLLITHLFGNPCNMKRIMEITNQYGLYLLEDCAHAFGSRYNGQWVGTFGCAAIFSTSFMKVPTTLGGGFVATNDDAIYRKVGEVLYRIQPQRHSYRKFLKLLVFTLTYYLNSFPTIFSVLGSNIFRYLKIKNPGMLRKIFYSELVNQKAFDPFEKGRFTHLQALVGISQIKRHSQMVNTRHRYAQIFDLAFKAIKPFRPLPTRPDGFNNHLYYIIRVSHNTEGFIDKAMRRGLYLMREDVWHCHAYKFSQPYEENCPAADALRPSLVRLPTSSFLSEKEICRVAETVCDLAKEFIR